MAVARLIQPGLPMVHYDMSADAICVVISLPNIACDWVLLLILYSCALRSKNVLLDVLVCMMAT